MALVLCPICRQLLRPAPPGWGTTQNDLPAGWDCPYTHASTTPPEVYEAARIHWLAHDQALQPHIHDRFMAATSEPTCSHSSSPDEVPVTLRRSAARGRPAR